MNFFGFNYFMWDIYKTNELLSLKKLIGTVSINTQCSLEFYAA